MRLSELNKVDLRWIDKASYILKYQSRRVVDHMLDIMRKSSTDGCLSWDQFKEHIKAFIPSNLEDKLTLFLRAFVPDSVHPRDVDQYAFS